MLKEQTEPRTQQSPYLQTLLIQLFIEMNRIQEISREPIAPENSEKQLKVYEIIDFYKHIMLKSLHWSGYLRLFHQQHLSLPSVQADNWLHHRRISKLHSDQGSPTSLAEHQR